jgi:hypothetical protein
MLVDVVEVRPGSQHPLQVGLRPSHGRLAGVALKVDVLIQSWLTDLHLPSTGGNYRLLETQDISGIAYIKNNP